MAWYLETFPEGAHVAEARERLAAIKRDKVADAAKRLMRAFVEAMEAGDTKTAERLTVRQHFRGMRTWKVGIAAAEVLDVEQIAFRWETPERAYLWVRYDGEKRALQLRYDEGRKRWALESDWWE